jgi:hypothetical protein
VQFIVAKKEGNWYNFNLGALASRPISVEALLGCESEIVSTAVLFMMITAKIHQVNWGALNYSSGVHAKPIYQG